MILHLEGIHIYSHFQAKNEMKILVKMVSKESAWSKKTPMLFGTNLTWRA